MPGHFVILQRINLGLVALLGRLEARANWRRITLELWPSTNGPASSPLGELEAAWWHDVHGPDESAGRATRVGIKPCV